jgi:hypothetical protein
MRVQTHRGRRAGKLSGVIVMTVVDGFVAAVAELTVSGALVAYGTMV